MAVVHVALERRFLGSFPAIGADPILEARRAAAEHGALPEAQYGEARCLVRDGRAHYSIAASDAGWTVCALHGAETLIPMGRFTNEALAHDWLLSHLGFVASRSEVAVN